MNTGTVLDKIKAYKLEEVAARKIARPLADVEEAAREAGEVRDFTRALHRAARSGYGLIAEVKKASPSKGLIREDFNPPVLAAAYEEGGAACLSVLTDTPSFQGADEFLVTARAAVSLPVLRKDFMYDTYQVAEARAMGADCILIIMASVSDNQAQELQAAATEWGMASLIEVHDAEELERSHAMSSPLLGINNRNLKTFETTLDTTRKLSQQVPHDKIIISESGLSTASDLDEMAVYGARCFLIGESLMRKDDVAAATKTLLAHDRSAMNAGL
ncbi:MAG: indole-3-glycerol phosphate synthase TrpC [Paracoccaceae bacterium]|nr:indole-3-glycerol phosphate synthase TrpC [Paracoccaceae bacterium]